MGVSMPAAGTVTVTGLADTIRSIRGLMRLEVQQRIARAIDTVAQPIMLQARGNLVQSGAVRSGALMDALVTVPKVNPNRGRISVIIGPKKQRINASGQSRAKVYKVGSRNAIPAKYAHLVELGTRPHTYRMRTRRGIESFLHHGSRAKPFLGPAFAMAEGTILDGIGAEVGAIIEAQAHKESRLMARQASSDRAQFRSETTVLKAGAG